MMLSSITNKTSGSSSPTIQSKQQQEITTDLLVSSMNNINSNNNNNLNQSFDSFGNNTRLITNINHSRQLSYEFNEEQDTCLQLFDKWSPVEQVEFTENLLRRMCHFQHGHINNFLKPMLQRDFISSLPGSLYTFNDFVKININLFYFLIKSKRFTFYCRNNFVLFRCKVIMCC